CDRQVILVDWSVQLVAGGIAALIEKEARQLLVPRVAGRGLQLDEPRLDDLMPGRRHQLAGPEGLVEQVGELLPDVEQAPLAGGAVVRVTRLEQVSRVVELVA